MILGVLTMAVVLLVPDRFPPQSPSNISAADVKVGTQFLWNGKPWEVVDEHHQGGFWCSPKDRQDTNLFASRDNIAWIHNHQGYSYNLWYHYGREVKLERTN
jgi:hypothetical protein